MRKLPQRGLRQHALPDQLGRILDPIEEAAEPEQGLQIPEPALALLDVRLEQIAAVARTLMARVALGELGFEEHPAPAAHHLGLEAAPELREERRIAPEKARFEQARADLQVGAGEARAFGDRARRLADLEPEIPEPVKQKLDHLLCVRGPLVGMQEQQIDVRERRQLGAAVATDRGHGESLAGRRVGQREEPREGEIEQPADQRIDQSRAPEDHRLGVVVGVKSPLQGALVHREPLAQPAQQDRRFGHILCREQGVDLGPRIHRRGERLHRVRRHR